MVSIVGPSGWGRLCANLALKASLLAIVFSLKLPAAAVLPALLMKGASCCLCSILFAHVLISNYRYTYGKGIGQKEELALDPTR